MFTYTYTESPEAFDYLAKLLTDFLCGHPSVQFFFRIPKTM